MQLTKLKWVAAVTERDIDILILEELHVSENFRNWLAHQIAPALGQGVEFLGAVHSLREAKLGETDLLFAFQDHQGRSIAVLLEDKIDAAFTNRQAERYGIRRDRLTASGQFDAAMTCLLAPQRYLDSNPDDIAMFDRAVSYEAVRDQIKTEDTPRARYRANFVQEAIDQNRRDYVATPDEDVTAFWKAYFEMSCVRVPHLKMKPPGNVKPASSGFFYFVDCLPKGVKIVHKTRFDAVDLQIGGTDVRLLAEHIGDHRLAPGMSFVQAAKSAAIRIKVPTIVLNQSFDKQSAAVAAALDAAARLLDFYEQYAAEFFPVVSRSAAAFSGEI